tara:strand:- start:1202 stop:1333 length:132 start_codon:yes stop_codon:yes gene_type:complete
MKIKQNKPAFKMKKSPVKKKFFGLINKAGQTAGQIIKRERLMI